MTEPLTDEDRKKILLQAKKPYGSVDEKYLRDWLLGALATIDVRDKQIEAWEWLVGRKDAGIEVAGVAHQIYKHHCLITTAEVAQRDDCPGCVRFAAVLALTVADYPGGE